MTVDQRPQMSRPLRSPPITGVSALLRAGPPAHHATRAEPRLAACTSADGVTMCLLTFHARAADQVHVASMPDTTWPISGHPPGSSRDPKHRPGFDVNCLCYDTSAAIRLRSSPWSPPDTSRVPFPRSLTTTVFSQRSTRRFEASPRRAAPKGQTFISHTAPPTTNPAYLMGLPSMFVTHASAKSVHDAARSSMGRRLSLA